MQPSVSQREPLTKPIEDRWPTLGEEAVPMRSATARELEREHELLLREMAAGPRRRQLRLPSRRAVLIGAGALALLASAVGLAGLGGGHSAPRPATKPALQTTPTAPSATETRQAQRLTQARRRRRAALHAREEADRRRAAHARAAAKAHKERERQAPVEAAAPEMPAPAPPPPPSPPISSPPTQAAVQQQFGFEQ